MRLFNDQAEAQGLAEGISGPGHAMPADEEVDLGDLKQYAATHMEDVTVAHEYSSIGSNRALHISTNSNTSHQHCKLQTHDSM